MASIVIEYFLEKSTSSDLLMDGPDFVGGVVFVFSSDGSKSMTCIKSSNIETF